MRIEFSQEVEALGESGLIEIDELSIILDGVEIESFDNYNLEYCYPPDLGVNPRKDRVCFVAKKYPAKTFPAFQHELESRGSTVLCTYDLYAREIVREEPVPGAPLNIQWDKNGDFPVIAKKILPGNRQSIYDTRFEFMTAWMHMNTGGTITDNDPIKDPACLEHYLFYYDPRYCGFSPFEYASRQRNKYFTANDIPIPYDVPPEPIVPKIPPIRFTREEALSEIRRAYLHVNSSDLSLTAMDPVYDPARLEYYLFTKPLNMTDFIACERAQEERLAFLKQQNLFVPYDKVISVSSDDLTPPKTYSREEAKEELVNAVKHVLSLGADIPDDDPINSEGTLEYYLFANNKGTITPDVCRQAIQERNRYFELQKIRINYEWSILDNIESILSEIDMPGISLTDTTTPAPQPEEAQEAQVPKETQEATKSDYAKDYAKGKKNNGGLILILLGVILLGFLAYKMITN